MKLKLGHKMKASMRPQKSKVRLGMALCALFIGLCVTSMIHSISHAQLPTTVLAEDKAVRESMVVMTRQLGTTCLTCHNLNNFASAEKLDFKIAKDHIRLTQLLIDNGFNGQNNQPKADCFMCHRGQLKPAYKENFDPMTMKKEPSKEAPGKGESK